MKYIDDSCAKFCDGLSSKAPVPGGGGASAYVGSLGIALGNMVGYLTVGKKKYAAVEGEIRRLIEDGEELRKQLMDLVQADAEAFAPLSRAYGLPKETDEDCQIKEKVMEECLRKAAQVPLEIMRLCAHSLELLEKFAIKGSTIAISDAGTGAAMCKAALEGGALNVYVNTKLMKDRDYAERLNRETDELLKNYGSIADKIYSTVLEALK